MRSVPTPPVDQDFRDTRKAIKHIHTNEPKFFELLSIDAKAARDEELQSSRELESKALGLITILGVVTLLLVTAGGAWVSLYDRKQDFPFLQWIALGAFLLSVISGFLAFNDAIQTLRVRNQSVVNPIKQLEFQDEPIVEFLRHRLATLLVSRTLNYEKNNLKSALLRRGYRSVLIAAGLLILALSLIALSYVLSAPIAKPE